jgi:pyruvate kinase
MLGGAGIGQMSRAAQIVAGLYRRAPVLPAREMNRSRAEREIGEPAEAAHLPVVWATQVLESLAKTGRPSRAEITDAAMGERAECVMLNKGAHVLDAIRMLDDILRRMQAHQAKKRPLLRALRSFRSPAAAEESANASVRRAAPAPPQPR